jgi:flagellar protein FlbD
MIILTRFNNKNFVVNAELIEFVEATPDTIITTTSGKKLIVKEPVEEVVRKVIEYRRLCFPEKRFKPMSEEELGFFNKEFGKKQE